MDERLRELVWRRAGDRCEYCLIPNRVKTLQRRWSTPVPKVKDLDELNSHLLECCRAERERDRNGTDRTTGELFERDRAASC